jgi:TonB family protein
MKNILILSLLSLSIYLNAQTSDTPRSESPIVEPKDYLTTADVMPVFPGCEMLTNKDERFSCSEMQFVRFVEQNIMYPKQALEMGCEGVVYISFIINKEGMLERVEVASDQTPGCGLKEEALDIVKSFNNTEIRWAPGEHNGEPVNIKMMIPIKFGTEAYKKSFKKKKN